MQHPRHSIMQSTWFTRGWTYQEAILSKRRLFFTEEQVYFECDNMSCYGSLYMPLLEFHTKTNARFQPFLWPSLFAGRHSGAHFKSTGLSPQEEIKRFEQHIRLYSSPKLTFDSDILNAFGGITRRFYTNLSEYSRKSTRSSIYGLQVSVESRDDIIHSSLISLMPWRHPWKNSQGQISSPRRREKLPSWSWVGWEGEVFYDLRNAWYTIPREEFTFCAAVYLVSPDESHIWDLYSQEVISAISDHRGQISSVLRFPKPLILDASKMGSRTDEWIQDWVSHDGYTQAWNPLSCNKIAVSKGIDSFSEVSRLINSS
jgi:hypothetical protein